MADVQVVGAGPVGLTMAAELARHGQRCRLIDRLTGLAAHLQRLYPDAALTVASP
ncbi:FAD-dependent monooxygenase [Roseomonas gilardii]|uniref:FAD-dependent monooxygenase n=1 Tax=Roseomonas gilardii TaxID=257708 RepID=UPI0004B47CB7|nr:FAD-dependent monooxygenase [Roseomonas gilardii]SUE44228.1 FAD binding domain [Roseomonas gilardii subsp. rosea]